MPGMNNLAAVPLAMLNMLIGAADSAIESYCKRILTLRSYVEYYNGANNTEFVLKQRPVWCGVTVVAAGSNGVVLPQSTINVGSTANFPPGTGGNPNATPPTLNVQTGNGLQTTVTYTGVTATSFTGCVGGIGTLATGYVVSMPSVFWDPNGQYGQAPNAFAPNTQMFQGNQFSLVLDTNSKSHRGTVIRSAGGPNGGWIGSYPENYYSGKLAARRLAVWPVGFGTIKACYSAGYYPIPFDLQYAATMLVANMVRIQPTGTNLSSESLGGYSYSVLNKSEDPELGEVRRTLAKYREPSFGMR